MPKDRANSDHHSVARQDEGVRVRPFIHVDAHRRSLHFSEKEIQSRMSTLNPDALDLEYTRMMMGFLLFSPTPAHIGMVGLGGGSLAKFCYRYLPSTTIVVAEIDPDVIAMRDQFLIPPDDHRFTVIEADGAEYLRQRHGRYDVLLIDGYDVSGIPEPLCSASFYQNCYEVLMANGLLVANFHVNSPDYPVYLDRIRQSFGVAVMEVVDDDMTNSVVFACKGDLLDHPNALSVRRPEGVAKDAWRQLMPTFKVIAATHTLR